MSSDTERESFDTIQTIANELLIVDGLPDEVREGLRLIEALVRHRDLGPDIVAAEYEKWQNSMKRFEFSDVANA
jgi:hypothetical protein